MKLDWHNVVKTALMTRKELGLTQKKHAALAGVSIPTMVSFEKGEDTISMGKVYHILRIVGMIEKPKPPPDTLQLFTQDSHQGWIEKTKSYPPTCPMRHPHGHVTYSFAVKGELKKMDFSDPKSRKASPFEKALEKIAARPFDIFSYCLVHDGILERTFSQEDITNYSPINISLWDFWRISPMGFGYLQGCYAEDLGLVEPKKIIDLSLPLLRLADLILYSYRFAKVLCQNPADAVVEIRATYTGLDGRTLVNWCNPLDPLRGYPRIIQNDSVEIHGKFLLAEIYNPLEKIPLYQTVSQLIYRLLKDFYAYFDFYEIEYEFIETAIKKYIRKDML